MMGKPNTILDFFKRKNAQSSNANVSDASSPTSDIIVSENSSKKSRRVDVNEFDISSLEFDPGLRRQIWEYNVNQRDEIRRAYIKAGPYQNLEIKIIFVAFNLRGTIYFLHGLNIRAKKMQHFVYHAFSLISHLGILRNVYSL